MDQEAFWLHWEQELPKSMVNLVDYGFEIKRSLFTKGICKEDRCFARPAVADALSKAKEQLPAGYNFVILDCYRSWEEQQLIHQWNKDYLSKENPNWSTEYLDEQLDVMSPNDRIIPRFDKHRYGGAVDLSIINAEGEQLNMGAFLADGKVEECRLLFYEMRNVEDAEKEIQANRRMLINAMEFAAFEPYLPEWWHWGFNRDIA